MRQLIEIRTFKYGTLNSVKSYAAALKGDGKIGFCSMKDLPLAGLAYSNSVVERESIEEEEEKIFIIIHIPIVFYKSPPSIQIPQA